MPDYPYMPYATAKGDERLAEIAETRRQWAVRDANQYDRMADRAAAAGNPAREKVWRIQAECARQGAAEYAIEADAYRMSLRSEAA